MSEEDASLFQKLRDWGNTNPTKRAVAGFVPAVGQVLDAADVMDPDADMRTRLGHVVTATPWGKLGKILNVLRKGKKGRRARDPVIDDDNLTKEQQDALRKQVDDFQKTLGQGEDLPDNLSWEEIAELRKQSEANMRRTGDLTADNAELEVINDTLRRLRRAAVPTGAGILGTAAAAKYMDDDD